MSPREIHTEWQRTLRQTQPYRTSQALWLTVLSAILLTIVMLMGAMKPHTMQIEDSFHLWYTAGANLVIFMVLYLYIFYIIRLKFSITNQRIIGITGVLFVAALLSMANYNFESAIFGKENTSYNLMVMLIYYLTAGVIAYLVVLLMVNITRYQRTLVEKEHLAAENMLIHYETLERQVSPHFLFNSLNTLDGLIGTDDPRAHSYLLQLASIFRYSMQKQKVVLLKDELEFTQSYIYMMQIRYGDNLTVETLIDPSLLTYYVVPISIQLLVENSIKHNVVSNRHPLHVVIATTDHLTLKVTNPLQPKTDTETSAGIGLSNLQQRYSLIFHRDIQITQTDQIFEVEIPLVERYEE